jgi:deoxyribose-phosphate aldolase
MELDHPTLSQRMILTAAMPFDALNAIKYMLNQSVSFKGFAVLPSFVQAAKKLLKPENSTKLIGLAGYPAGGVSTKTKVNEVRDLAFEGVDEVHVVANTGQILSGAWEDVQCELISVVHSSKDRPVSLIMEAAYLNDQQIMRLVNLCVDVGIHSIGTSSGWLPMNPDVDQISKIKEMVYGRLPIMVAGTVNKEQAVQLIQSGIDSIIIRLQHAEAILAQLN